jgi:hypothetical protein
MKNRLAALLFACATIVAPTSFADDPFANGTDVQALRAAVKADKKGLVASTLQLTPAEAKKFWPIYDDYQRALDASNRQRTLVAEELLELTKPLSDQYAKVLASELLAADETELTARRKVQRGVMRALPPKKAARYLQLESKIRAYIAYDIAVTFPLVR